MVRPHDPLTRLAERLLGAPPAAGARWRAQFFVRARPPEVAGRYLSPRALEVLEELADRAPRLFAEDGEVAIVLEGVELVHERLETIIALLSSLTGESAPPPEGAPDERSAPAS